MPIRFPTIPASIAADIQHFSKKLYIAARNTSSTSIAIINGLVKYRAIYPLVRYFIPTILKLSLNKSKKSG